MINTAVSSFGSVSKLPPSWFLVCLSCPISKMRISARRDIFLVRYQYSASIISPEEATNNCSVSPSLRHGTVAGRFPGLKLHSEFGQWRNRGNGWRADDFNGRWKDRIKAGSSSHQATVGSRRPTVRRMYRCHTESGE